MRKVSCLLLILFLSLGINSHAQQAAAVRLKLEAAADQIPQLDEVVDLSVIEMETRDLLYSLGNSNHLNISVAQEVQGRITLNFEKVRMLDLLAFISGKFSLDIEVTGSTLHFFPYKPVIRMERKLITVEEDSLFHFSLKNDTLGKVLQELSRSAAVNFILEPGSYGTIVSANANRVTINNAVRIIASAAGFRAVQIDSGLIRLEKLEVNTQSPDKRAMVKGKFSISRHANGFRLMADEGSISDILKEASSLFKVDLIVTEDIKGTVTANLDFNSFDHLLEVLLTNTSYLVAGQNEEKNYLIVAGKSAESNNTTAFIKLLRRSISGILDWIPSEMKKELELKPVQELNGILVSGPVKLINTFREYIKLVDIKIPVIDIEVYIVDVRDSRMVSTGLEAGLRTAQGETSGKVFPGAEVELNSGSVNEIMSGITKTGLFNLGRVGSAFYLKLKLLEEQGLLKIRSTPRLATLNGHEARLSIGRTEYYLELQNNIIGTQNPQNLLSQQYKSVNADLSLTLLPAVSEDEEITLDIHVNQTNFTERISPSAPPGTISRDFKSMVRVRNGEMLVLGGLEENTKTEASSGLPILSRIPVIKWLFSSRNKGRNKNQLTIFIKPTVIW